MKSEIEFLEKEELVHHQSQLQVAQERLRTKRRSDLAKRMQESQRLQVLRERKAELEETRRSKVVDFKQKMIAAAERALERESMVLDVLYDNIGDALAADNDFPFSDGNDSVVLDDDMSAMMSGAFGAVVADTVSPGARAPGGNNQPHSMDFSFEQFRAPSAFEEHLKFEQKQFAIQLQALRQVHTAPKPASATLVNPTSARKEGGMSLPPLLSARFGRPRGFVGFVDTSPSTPLAPTLMPYLSGLPASTTLNRHDELSPRAATSGGLTTSLSPADGARIEHARVREELKRLIAQSSEPEAFSETINTVTTGPTMQPPPAVTENNTLTAWRMEPADLDIIVQQKLEALEAREAQDASRQTVIDASAVPFEDTLRKGNTVILEDAEANNRARFAAERVDRERIERQERLQNRTATMFGSATILSETDASTKTRSKTRRVSMLLEGEGDVSNSEIKSPLTADNALEGIPLAASTDSLSPTLPRSNSITIVDTPSSGKSQSAAAIRRRDSLPAALAIMSNAAERQQLIFEQQHARFMAKRGVQKEELSSMKRKLLELQRQDEEAAEELNKQAQQRNETSFAAASLPSEAQDVRSASHTPTPSDHQLSLMPSRALSEERLDVHEDTNEKPSGSANAAVEAIHQERETAAVMIQCAARSLSARRTFGQAKAAYAATVERLAKIVLEEEQLMEKEHQMILTQLAQERDHLQSLLQREGLLDEAATLRTLQQQEDALLAAVELAKVNARRGEAAVDIQRIVRGRQTRVWYRAVLVARDALLAASFTRTAAVIQTWWRWVARRHDAHRRVAMRKQLVQRLQHATTAPGAIKVAAVKCIQRLARRRLTAKACSLRRKLAQNEVRHDLQEDAALVIQRQWRKYWLHRESTRMMVYHAVDVATLTASVLESSVSQADEEQDVILSRVSNAATTIAKYSKRFLLRDEWRQRWLQRVLNDAVESAESVRQERRVTGRDEESYDSDQ